MKHVLLLPLLLSLGACAPVVTKFDMAGTDGSVSVPVTDLRPTIEKQSEIFSLMITSSEYGLYRKGDATLDPPLTQVFRRRAFEKLGADAMKDVTIHHMVVYLNLQSELRRGAIGAGFGGVIGSLIATSGMTGANLSQSLADRAAFDREEYQRALYTAAENPKKSSVFVVYIDAEIGGRRVFTRTLAPTTGPEGRVPYVLAVDSAIEYYLQQYQAAAAPPPATAAAETAPAAATPATPAPAAQPAAAPAAGSPN